MSEATREFIEACQRGTSDRVVELLDATGESRVDVHAGNEDGFRSACVFGHVEVVRLLLSLEGDRRIDVHAEDEDGFCWSCSFGHSEVVRLLLSLEGDRWIDVHAKDEFGFREACYNGHVDVVRLLLSLEGDRRIDVHADDEYGFRWACANCHTDLVRLLLSLEGDQRVDVHAECDSGFQWACCFGNIEVVKLLLTDSIERLPSAIAYTECYKGPEPYEHWIWRLRPRTNALLRFRAAHDAWSRRDLCFRCAESGSVLEFERSMVVHRVRRTLSREDVGRMEAYLREGESRHVSRGRDTSAFDRMRALLLLDSKCVGAGSVVGHGKCE